MRRVSIVPRKTRRCPIKYKFISTAFYPAKHISWLTINNSFHQFRFYILENAQIIVNYGINVSSMSSLIISSPVPSRFTHVRAWRANYTVIHLTIRDTPSWLDGDPPDYTWYTAFYQVVVYHAIFNVIHHQVRYKYGY